MKTFNRFLLMAVVFLSIHFVAASGPMDEIVLKEGKTLQGTITGEDAQEYTIRLHQNMNLRVKKSDVAKVIRSAPVQKKNEVRLSTLMTKTAVSTSTASAATPAAPPPKSVVQNVKPESHTTRTAHGSVSSDETISYQVKSFRGPTFSNVMAQIQAEPKLTEDRPDWITTWEGTSQKEGAKSKWKSVVLRSTVTVQLPSWPAPASADSGSVDQWNLYLQERQADQQSRINIYHSELDSLAESLAALQADDEPKLRQESQRLFDQMKSQADKRQEGYERRKTLKPLTVKNPKKASPKKP